MLPVNEIAALILNRGISSYYRDTALSCFKKRKKIDFIVFLAIILSILYIVYSNAIEYIIYFLYTIVLLLCISPSLSTV